MLNGATQMKKYTDFLTIWTKNTFFVLPRESKRNRRWSQWPSSLIGKSFIVIKAKTNEDNTQIPLFLLFASGVTNRQMSGVCSQK